MFGPRLNRQELKELRGLSKIIAVEQFKLEQVKGNTYFVPKGEQWVKTQQGIITVLENKRTEFISVCCARRKIEGKVSVDLESGRVYQVKQ